MKILRILALTIFILATPPALWIGIRLLPPTVGVTPPSTVELMATLFGAATIVLGALAIVIAVLAIWGYNAIKEESRSVAHGAATEIVSEHMKSKEVQDRLRQESRKIIEEEMAKVKEGLDLAGSQPPQGTPTAKTQEESQSLGKRYSEDKGAG